MCKYIAEVGLLCRWVTWCLYCYENQKNTYPKSKNLNKLALKRKDFGRDFLLYECMISLIAQFNSVRPRFFCSACLSINGNSSIVSIKGIFQAVRNFEFLKRSYD